MIFKWGNREVNTYGELGSLMEELFEKGDIEQGKQFMAAYREFTEHADDNIGYMTGYYDVDKMVKMQDFFDVGHPIFGRKAPSPEEAFEAGKQMGEEIKRRQGNGADND